jgi:hypothetical protein
MGAGVAAGPVVFDGPRLRLRLLLRAVCCGVGVPGLVVAVGSVGSGVVGGVGAGAVG